MKIYKMYQFYIDNYRNHQMIKEVFPGVGKILFRRYDSFLLVLSDINIDQKYTNHIDIEYIGVVDEKINKEGNFNIRLNAARSRGKKRFSVDNDKIKEFLDKKFSDIGADVKINNVKIEGLCSSEKKNHIMKHKSVIVNGTYSINDEEKFSKCVKMGIGHGKSLGFGLLNVF